MPKKKDVRTCESCAHHGDTEYCEDCEKKDLWEAGEVQTPEQIGKEMQERAHAAGNHIDMKINKGDWHPVDSPEAQSELKEMVAKHVESDPLAGLGPNVRAAVEGAIEAGVPIAKVAEIIENADPKGWAETKKQVKSHPANDPPKCSNALGIPDYQLHVGRGDKVAWKVSLESTRWKMSISHKSLRELEHAADDYLQDVVRSKLRVQPDMKILAGEYDLMVSVFATELKKLAYKAARDYARAQRVHMEYPELPALDSD